MANPQKAKGARNEWRAIRLLTTLCPDLLVPNPRPKLGAGRKDDEGDLIAFNDVAVQVKAHNDYLRACRLAADGAHHQRLNMGAALGVGMVPIPHARQTGTNWLFTTLAWPTTPPSDTPHYGLTSEAATHIRNPNTDPTDRLAVIRRSGKPDLWIGTAQSWTAAYRQHRLGTPLSA